MKIAIDARPLITRQVGGAEQRARNIMGALAALRTNHEFRLFYQRPEEAEHFDPSFVMDLPPNFVPEELGGYQFPLRFHMASRVLNTLARAIGRADPDVYLAFTPFVPRINACPVVPTIHDVSFELDPVVRRTTAGRYLRRLTTRSVAYARRIITVSTQTKSDTASVYGVNPDAIDVIYNGIDPIFTPTVDLPMRAKVHIDNDITGRYVLAVGADIPRRNYSRLLAAMRQLWDLQVRAQWVLAGRDDWKVSDIYHEARDAGVLGQLRFVHSPSNGELSELYCGATMTCCASSFEGFGLSVLESMACGTAAACSDMRSLREVAGDAAVYFAHDDAEAMAQAIGGLLEDAEYRRQLKYRGLQRAGLFTWKTAAELTLQTLEAAAR